MRTLFLQAPSFEGFDGGAGSRYQARREIRSFWYPTWLAQPAALVEGSRLVDAPPAGLTLEDVTPLARDYELAVLHTSAASFAHDVRVAEALKGQNPKLRIGFVGETGWEIHCPAESAETLWNGLLQAGAEYKIRPFGVEAQRLLRLEKRHVIVGVDTDALTNPYEADMSWAIKLDKPDFVGKA